MDLEIQQTIKENLPTKKINKTLILQISVFVIIFILLASNILLASQFYILKKTVSESEVNITSLTSQVKELKSKTYVDFSKDIEVLKKDNETLKDEALANVMNNLLIGRVVTDDFVVDRANCAVVSKANVLIIDMDLSTQPTFAIHYIGQGRFDISDRELKSSISNIANQSISILSRVCKEKGIDTSKGFINISIKNYEIATFENGIVKLKGE